MITFNRKLGKSFKKVGKVYHLGRRDYPNKLISDIIKLSDIKKDCLILDVGCGTGKSTIPFVKKGFKIIGIDISKDMLRVARQLSKGYKNANYKETSFEKYKLGKKPFDLILFGSALHWIHPKIAYKKIAYSLKADGSVAIFWRLVDHDSTKFLLKIKRLFLKHCSEYYHIAPSKKRAKESVKKVVNLLENIKLFAKPLVKSYNSLESYNKLNLINWISSYSWVASLNKEDKERFMKELNEIMDKENYPIRLTEKFSMIIAKVKEK